MAIRRRTIRNDGLFGRIPFVSIYAPSTTFSPVLSLIGCEDVLMTRLSRANTRESHLGAFNLVFRTVHLKRVISPADVQSPLGGISQTNEASLEVPVLSSGLADAALILVEGRLFV